ncbi:hypothetical protein TSAR_010117 [Trichomalopsis sarcophagae]|uniref:Odorant receptor n=1 Tax=Trichomalopsis sarcophagae TaxID=543379 RepID=A0A232FK82_9HYME|nr:hypothetical protein TSAR_010117 [Trichomalopsis sarcophagae]
MLQALESKDIVLLIKFATFIWFLLWQIFSFCFAGQYLLNKGETITGAMYDSDWYNIESNDVKAISFIIKKTQRPLSVTAGKYIPLSVTSFAAILKTSFSYLSVLRATMVAENPATYRYIEIGLKIIGSYPGTSESKGFIIIIILIIINLPFQILNALEAYRDINIFMNSFGPTLVMFNCMDNVPQGEEKQANSSEAADLWDAGIYCAAGEYLPKQSENIYEDLSKCS